MKHEINETANERSIRVFSKLSECSIRITCVFHTSTRVCYLKCHVHVMLVSQLQYRAEHSASILSELNQFLWTNIHKYLIFLVFH